MNIKQGQIVPLFIQLFDCATDHFVLAYVTDDEGVELEDSPFVLSPQGSWGGYSNYNLTMPNVPFIVAQYIVFDDSGYEILSVTEGADSQTFTLGDCGCP